MHTLVLSISCSVAVSVLLKVARSHRIDVATDRRGGGTECLDQVGDARNRAFFHEFCDQAMPFGFEHAAFPPSRKTRAAGGRPITYVICAILIDVD